MKTFSIDNASRLIGWSFWQDGDLHEFGVIDLSPYGRVADDRVLAYYQELMRLFTLYTPEECVVETPFVRGRGNSGLILSQYLGIVKLALMKQGIDYHPMSPTEAKLGFTGDGKAKKHEMQQRAHDLYPDVVGPDVTEDEADAIGIGYAHLVKHNRLRVS